tara:strand:+ start:422 stop:931 length:510 start_codon:yes stop_codon:yes gene_type:complete
MTLINPSIQQQTLSVSASNIISGFPNGITESLMELKYSFEGFSGVAAGVVKNDVVVFVENSSNSYGAGLEIANTDNPAHANKNLMVFVSYQNGTLIVMHKGFIDFENTSSSSLGSWTAGNNIYSNQKKIETTTPSTGGSWVKSIGFCVPNLQGKKRIWFESDSTFFTIG